MSFPVYLKIAMPHYRLFEEKKSIKLNKHSQDNIGIHRPEGIPECWHSPNRKNPFTPSRPQLLADAPFEVDVSLTGDFVSGSYIPRSTGSTQ